MKNRFLHLLTVVLVLCAVLCGIPAVAASADETAAAPAASIDYFALSVEKEGYFIEYAVKYTGFEPSKSNVGMLYWTSEPADGTFGTQAAVGECLGYTDIGGETYYIYQYNDLTILQLCDVIWARAYAVIDGTYYYSNTAQYSVVTYAERKLGLVEGVPGTDNDALKSVLNAMLEYGAAAQIKLGYNTDRLPTDILPENKLTVSFNTDGGSDIPAQTVLKYHKLTKPADPTREGYTFAGWYNGDRAWVFEANSVTEAITLTAKWTKSDTHTHEWESEWSHDDLTHWYACENCDAKKGEDAHTWSDWVITTPAGCETEGTRSSTCACGAVRSKSIPATGHHSESAWQMDDENGQFSHWHVCETCGKKFDEEQHRMPSDYRIEKEPTCTEDGEGVLICTVCGYERKVTIKASGHQPRKAVDGRYLKDVATCEHAAVYYESCATCHVQLEGTFESGIAPGHVFSMEAPKEAALKEAATCQSPAVYYRSCLNCSAISNDENDVFTWGDVGDHRFERELADDAKLKTAADCSNCAVYYKTCLWCDETASKEEDTFEYGDLRKHDFGVKNKISATCTENGKIEYVCSYEDCRFSMTVEDPDAPMTGHDTQGVTATEKQIGETCEYQLTYACNTCGASVDGGTVWHHSYVASIVKDATCEEAGLKSYKCSSCGDTSKTDEEIPADPTHHNWVEGTPADGTRTDTCKTCGETKTVKVFEGNTGSANAGDLKDSEVELDDAAIKLDDGLADSLGDQDVTVGADKLVGDERNRLNLTPEQLEQLGDNPVYNFTLTGADGKTISNFGNNKVTVRLPYTLAEGEDVDNIAVWYIDDEGTLISVKGTYSNGYVTFETSHFSYYTVTRLTPRERCELYGHEYVSKTVAGSCTEDGYTLEVCVRCHDKKKTVTAPAQGHQYDVTTIPAACTETGKTQYTCRECGYSFTVSIPATGHNWVKDDDASYAATCAVAGRNVYRCTECEGTRNEELAQPAHTFGDAVTVPATCEAGGYTGTECEVCHYIKKEAFTAPKGHSYSHTGWEWSEDKTSAQAVFTCGNDSTHVLKLDAEVILIDSEDQKCSGYSFRRYRASVNYAGNVLTETEDLTGGTKGHIYDTENWKLDGTEHWHECACGEKTDVTLHDWSVAVSTPATCTEAGYAENTCTVCGFVDHWEEDAAFGHDFKAFWNWAEDNKSATLTITCQHDASHTETYPAEAVERVITVPCSDYTKTIYTVSCTAASGETFTDTKVVEAGTPGHQFSDIWSRDESTHWHECLCGELADEAAHVFDTETVISPATCVSAGEAIRTCICGATKTVTLRATGEHDYRNGVCTVCGKAQSDCDHKTLHEETLILGSHGAAGDSMLVYETCECGEVKIFVMRKSSVLCQSKDQTMKSWTDEDGTAHAHMEMTCDICGVFVAAEATMRNVGCTSEMTCVYTFSRDGEVLVENLVEAESDTHHSNTERITVDLKKEYGACGGTVLVTRCTDCGEITGFGLDGDLKCAIELDEAFFTVPTDTYVDENGFEHKIYSGTCPNCGLTVSVEEWTEVDSACESEHFGVMMIRKGDTVIAKQEESQWNSTHEWEISYVLNGETCEDGVTVTESCPKCGTKRSYTTTSHDTVRETVDATTLGFCKGIIQKEVCQRCNTLTWSYVETSCDWNYSTDADGNEIATCDRCGMVKKTVYTQIGTENPCVTRVDVVITYTLNGTEVYRIEECRNYVHHDYETTYTLQGATCEDGVRVTQICRMCGEDDSYTTHGHIQEGRTIDAKELGMCEGSIDEEYCKACGTVLWINDNTACKWETTDASENTQTMTCRVCGAVKTITQSETEPDDNCEVEISSRITFAVNGEEVYSFAETYTTTRHNYEETIRLEEGKTCTDGYYLVYTCKKCGDKHEELYYGHRDIEERIIQGEETCGYSISIDVCKICGTVLHMSINVNGCTWTAVDPTTYVDADGYTHTVTDKTCSVCGIRIKEDEWTVPDEKYPQCAWYLHTITTLTLADGTTYEYDGSSYTNSHSFQYQYTLLDPDEGCDGGYLGQATCTVCGYETDFGTQYGHRYQDFVLNLEDSGCCEGTLSGRICEICHRLLDTRDWQFGCHFGFPTTETVTDKNGVEHTVATRVCKTCGLTTVVDSWQTERGGCYFNNFAKTTICKGEDVLLEFVRQEVEENHTWGEWSYEFDDEDLRCAGSFRAIRTCSKCNNRDEQWYNNHCREEQEILLEELGFCEGSATISTCRVCGKVISGRINFSTCQWETTWDETTGEETTKCSVCGVVEKSVYTEVKGEHCVVTAEKYTSYQKDGVEVLRIGGLDIWKNHTYIATFELNGDSCTDGYTVHKTCADCGDSLEAYTSSGHNTELVFRLEKTGACGEKHVIWVYSCACGEHTSTSTEGLTYDNDGQFQCDTCGLYLSNDSHTAKDGCSQIVTTQILVTEGGETLFRLNHVTTKVVHTFDTPTATVENGILTMTATCKVCGLERVSTRKMTYETAELTEHGKDGWYFELPFTPTESGRYTIESFTEGDTFVELYQLIDGNLKQIAFDDDSAGNANFRLTYRLEAGESYVYRIRFLNRDKSGAIAYTLNQTGDAETGADCEHLTEIFRIFAEGSTNCEDGVLSIEWCTACGALTSVSESHEHLTEDTRIDLGAKGACRGKLHHTKCICGEVERVIYVGCASTMTENIDTDEDGRTIHVTVYTCDSCGTRYEVRWYAERDASTCKETQTYIVTLNIGTEFVFDLTYTETSDSHDIEEILSYVNDGSTSCEDGVLVIETCRDCGEELNRYTTSEHQKTVIERIDLTACGSTCPGEAVLYRCLCGKFTSIELEDAQCKFSISVEQAWVNEALRESIPTADGSIYFSSSATRYTCAQTDPACGFIIRKMTYWVKVEGECKAVEHTVWQFGYNTADGTCAKEIDFLTGNERTYHTYKVTNPDGYSTHYDCADCDSSYYRDVTVDESGSVTKEEITARTKYPDGTYATRHEVTEYTTDDSVGRYQSYHLVEQTDRDGTTYSTLTTKTPYEAPFGTDSFKDVTESRQNGTITDSSESAYTMYFGNQYTLYEYYVSGDFWYRWDFTYSFEGECTRTEHYTNSDGEDRTETVNICQNFRYETVLEATCTQYGEQKCCCKVCGKVKDTFRTAPAGHMWFCLRDHLYVCTRCDMLNANGADGDVVLEDLTAAYGNGTDYVVGYWIRTGVKFSTYISLILSDGTEVVLSGVEITDVEGLNAVCFAKSAVEALAAEKGYEAGSYSVRISFVPDGDDGSHDYGVTFDSKSAEDTVTGNTTVSCAAAGEETQTVTVTIAPEVSGTWFFAYSHSDTTALVVKDSDGNAAEMQQRIYGIWSQAWFELEAGKTYTLTFAVESGYTGTVTLVVIAPETTV